MARKILNRKELRAENDAAETETRAKKTAKTEDGEKKKPVKRKSRAKTAKEVRLKAFWGVFNQSMKRVALFEYSQRKQADKKANELSTSAKTPHFVQPVKEVIEERRRHRFPDVQPAGSQGALRLAMVTPGGIPQNGESAPWIQPERTYKL